MNKTYQKLTLLLACLLLSGLTLAAFAQHSDHQEKAGQKTEAKFLGKGDGIESCPVSGEKIESKDFKADFYGRTVYFCCEHCLAAAQKNPELYVKKTEAEQKEAVKGIAAKEHDHSEHNAGKSEVKFLGKGDGITTCPVTGEPINKEIKAEINGRTIYACCADCLETVKKNPELYLKPVTK
ncbi:MAG: hypothetical protein U0Y68_19650 [Blastocatellia bacterium]